MAKPIWLQKEDLAREWCSRKNNNIKLTKDRVVFWDDDMKRYDFEFDIASYRQRGIEKPELGKKQYGEKNEADSRLEGESKSSTPYAISPGEVDHRKIVGMVKSTQYDGVAYEAILGDCFLLSRASADKKYMGDYAK